MPEKKPGPKRRKRPPASDTGAPVAFDRRAMEKSLADITRLLQEREFESIDEANAFLQQMMASGEPIAAPPRTPLEQAQDLMYDAWNATGRRRVQLAREALAISPDCADAYVLLAEESARTPEAARKYYQQGVEVGERALGPELFQENAGHFWGIVETRPYMRSIRCIGSGWNNAGRPTAVPCAGRSGSRGIRVCYGA